jgi:hypothetical protein
MHELVACVNGAREYWLHPRLVDRPEWLGWLNLTNCERRFLTRGDDESFEDNVAVFVAVAEALMERIDEMPTSAAMLREEDLRKASQDKNIGILEKNDWEATAKIQKIVLRPNKGGEFRDEKTTQIQECFRSAPEQRS